MSIFTIYILQLHIAFALPKNLTTITIAQDYGIYCLYFATNLLEEMIQERFLLKEFAAVFDGVWYFFKKGNLTIRILQKDPYAILVGICENPI